MGWNWKGHPLVFQQVVELLLALQQVGLPNIPLAVEFIELALIGALDHIHGKTAYRMRTSYAGNRPGYHDTPAEARTGTQD